MTDHLDQAVEAGVMAWQHDCPDGNRERARAKAIIASMLEPDESETDFIATGPTAEAMGYLLAIITIRQRAGLEE